MSGYADGAASASDSEDAEYSDAFDDNATTGHSSREFVQEQDCLEQMLDTTRARQASREGAHHHPAAGVDLSVLNGAAVGADVHGGPSHPRHAAESLSRESLRSGRSTGSNSNGRQNHAGFSVRPPGVRGSSQPPAAEAAYARGASAPTLGARPDYLADDAQSDRSEGMPPDDNAAADEGEPQGDMMALSYPSYSWHETLARFPSLLRLYPLAECNEGTMEDELFPAAGENDARAEEDSATDANARTDAEPGGEQAARGPEPQAGASAVPEHAVGGDATELPQGQGPAELHEELRGTWHSGTGLGTCTPPPCTPVRVSAGQVHATPRSAPFRGASRSRQGYAASSHADWQPSHLTSEGWSSGDLAAAWAEVHQVRHDLAQREREVAQREAAARRAEARNQAAARELDELRRRLDDYGEELENGVAALTAQQNVLREERRQTLELQARARRMCAAAVREDVVASKFREWDRRSLTPMSTMG